MRKILLFFLSISLLMIAVSGCNATEKSSLTDDNTAHAIPPLTDNTAVATDNNQPPIKDHEPVLDFEYVTNETNTGILINKYIGTNVDVVIPSKIENLPVLSLRGLPSSASPFIIEKGVFEGSNVRSVVIPETVTIVGDSAFYACKELTQVIFSANSNLMQINLSAFSNCIKLEKIDLSATKVKKIDKFAFRGCTELKEVKFPATLEEIREKSFYECFALTDVALPKNITKIEGGAFAYCSSLQRIVIPENLNLTALNEAILHHVPSLDEIIFMEGREEVIGYAFLQTDANVKIIVPESVKKFSPLPFLINPETDTVIIFLGNAPEIVDNETDWFGSPTIYYHQETCGWDTFLWKDKFELKLISSN